MEKRDEFTDQNALSMLVDKLTLPENNCRNILRALNRNGFVVKEIVADAKDDSSSYGTIESLNQKFERTKELDTERQILVNAIRREWNDIQKKYMPIFNAIATAIETTPGTSDTFPDIDDESDTELDTALEDNNGSSDSLSRPDA